MSTIYYKFRPGSGDWITQTVEMQDDQGRWGPADLSTLIQAQFVARAISGSGNSPIEKDLGSGVEVIGTNKLRVRFNSSLPDLDAEGIYEWMWYLTFSDRGPVALPASSDLPRFQVLAAMP